MTTRKEELALAVRRLVRTPGLTALIVATLAVGIGLTTAVFAIVHAVVLRPLPFQEEDRLVFPWAINSDGSSTGISYPDFLDLQAKSRALEHAGFYFPDELAVRGAEGVERVPGAWVSAGFLPALRIEPLHGRLFTSAEADRPGAPVALLSYGLWQRRFGGNPRIVGRTVEVNQVPCTVVGILPPGFRGLRRREEIFVPVPLVERMLPGLRHFRLLRNRDFAWGTLVGRLAPGVRPERALAEVQAQDRRRRHALLDARQYLLGRLGTRLPRLLVAASFVLLIACANVGHLLLTRAAGRQREMAVRAALGATRGRLVRHWLLEGLLLGAAGAVAGLLTAASSLDLLLAVLPLQLPPAIDVRINGPVLAFALALSLLGGALSVLAPALHSAWPDLAGSLKQGGRGASESRASRRTRSLLVATDVALALMLLMGAGLMVRSLDRIRSFDLGFRSEGVLSLSFEPPSHTRNAERVRLKKEILQRVEALPGVRHAAFTSRVFYDHQRTLMLRVMSPNLPVSATAQTYHVSTGFFRALGIPLEAGRDFVPADHRARPRCAIVNRSFVALYMPPGDPLGRRIVLADAPGIALTVIGVARDVHPEVRPGAPIATPQIYLPGLEVPDWDFNLVIAAEGDPDSLVSLVDRTIRQISPEMSVFNVARMEDRVAEARADTRSFAGLMSVFAGAALALAGLAIYSLVVSSIQQETRDIAVRRVLGAGPGSILRMVLVRGLAPVLLGIVLGLGGAFILARTLSTLLFDVEPLDPATFLLVPLFVAAAALAASLPAAQRALEIEPMSALRE